MMRFISSAFYIVFAMSMAGVFLFPVMLVLRVALQNLPKKYMALAWKIYFLRITCPVLLSSVFSIRTKWNRDYHSILRSLGLTFERDKGVLSSLSDVLSEPFHTTTGYKVIATCWLIIAIFLFVITCIRQHKIKEMIRARQRVLDGNIYQTKIKAPVSTGIFRRKYYVPEKVTAKQSSMEIAHMKAQTKRGSALFRGLMFLVTVMHWFNPLVWWAFSLAKKDEEMACDDRVLLEMGISKRGEYAQGIINMAKEETLIPFTTCTIFETDLQKRSTRMLYWKKETYGQQFAIWLLLSIFVFLIVFLRPLQVAWAGGTWQQESAQEDTSQSLNKQEDILIAQRSISSPSGLPMTINLTMTSGEKINDKYKGKFYISLVDSAGNEVDKENVLSLFQQVDQDIKELMFSEKMVLCAGDYNNDKGFELILGQRIKEKKAVKKAMKSNLFESKDEDKGKLYYEYIVLHFGEQSMERVSDLMYSTQKGGQESVNPGLEEDINTLFYLPVPNGRNYYQWNEQENRFEGKKLTQEEINQIRNVSVNGDAQLGEAKDFDLADSAGKKQMTVNTRSDSTGSQSIQKVMLGDEEMPAVQGYYCDLQWATEQDGSKDQYAILIYNGTKAQTFIIYDVKSGEEMYRHEDGNELLATTFHKYNGDDITFKKGGVVVYTLLEQNGEMLTISFAANADGNLTVRGSYNYNVDTKETSNLQFSQTTETITPQQ